MKTYRIMDDVSVVARDMWSDLQFGAKIPRVLFYDRKDHKFISTPEGGPQHFVMLGKRVKYDRSRYQQIGVYNSKTQPDHIREDIVYELKRFIEPGIRSSLGEFLGVMRTVAQ